jgi:hypothetical protein
MSDEQKPDRLAVDGGLVEPPAREYTSETDPEMAAALAEQERAAERPNFSAILGHRISGLDATRYGRPRVASPLETVQNSPSGLALDSTFASIREANEQFQETLEGLRDQFVDRPLQVQIEAATEKHSERLFQVFKAYDALEQRFLSEHADNEPVTGEVVALWEMWDSGSGKWPVSFSIDFARKLRDQGSPAWPYIAAALTRYETKPPRHFIGMETHIADLLSKATGPSPAALARAARDYATQTRRQVRAQLVGSLKTK